MWIRYSILTLAIIAFPFFAQAQVRITEIAWMGTTESQFGEWVELYNESSTDVPLKDWKLFEAGGDTIVFTFSKTIPAKGFLVLERTTGSVPDPLPSVSDEAGSFGGSGLSNGGEFLVLKDQLGETIQSLNFSAGWPAGDSDSKQTMQWDGTTWITAPPTPKTGLQKNDNEESSPPQVITGGKAYTPTVYEAHIDMTVPPVVYTYIPIECTAKTYTETGLAYNGIFLWNMGDGTTYQSKTPITIQHTYKYPGTYTISFGFFRTPYDKKPLLMDSIERLVVVPKILFTISEGKGFQFANTDTKAIDISGWTILSTNQTYTIPALSIVGPKSTIIIPFETIGIREPLEHPLLLKSTDWHTIATIDSGPVTVNPEQSSSTLSKAPVVVTQVASAASLNDVVIPSEEKKVPTQQKSRTKAIFLGAALLVVIGLFLLLERFMAKGE